MTHPKKNIRVKLVVRGGTGKGTAWARHCPGGQPQWGRCTFIFDPFEREYDWLVMTDDVPRVLPGKEELACPRSNTILVTSEPSSVTRYGKAFAAQFGTVLTSQEEKALPHRNAIRSQTGNIWFYGKSYDEVLCETPPAKTSLVSTVCSSKQQAHTMHARRYNFTQRLKTELPELEIFGHGVRYIENKFEALDPYKFHLAIENHIAPHVWTEKLADAFLGYTVPIYCGCPNVFDYFPEDSVIPIDINDIEGSIKTVQRVLTTEGEYERRLEAVKEARRRVIEEYNLPAMLSRIIENAEPSANRTNGDFIYSRRRMRMRHTSEFFRFAIWRTQNALQSILKLKKGDASYE
ncbi:MAG: glycosyltransferase [Kiritimatiellales bacterium]|nr:glycosyltransferase [Kiritimatiellota bacterium]MBL7012340.1 glycosyltransferase [Kiritimatiellales bacterium]